MITLRIDSSTNPSPAVIERTINEEFKRAMLATSVYGESRIAERTPVGVSGHLRQGITGRAETFAVEFGVQGSAAKYGKFVEPGRKPGKFPPPSPIELWVKRTDKGRKLIAWVKRKYKIKNEKQALQQATFLKQRAIARKGTRGAFMFKKSIPEIKKFIETQINQAIANIEKRLSDK